MVLSGLSSGTDLSSKHGMLEVFAPMIIRSSLCLYEPLIRVPLVGGVFKTVLDKGFNYPDHW